MLSPLLKDKNIGVQLGYSFSWKWEAYFSCQYLYLYSVHAQQYFPIDGILSVL